MNSLRTAANKISRRSISSLLGEKSKNSIPLPSQFAANNVAGQGWSIDTEVRASNVAGAGNGRFSLNDVPINKIVMTKPIVSMASTSSISELSLHDTILFKNSEEIEKFIELYEKEGGQSRVDTVECLAHFMFSLSNINGVALFVSTVSLNHANPGKTNNVHLYLENECMIGKTIADVKAGDELFVDYGLFNYMEDFYVDFCENEGVKDVVTNIKQFVDI